MSRLPSCLLYSQDAEWTRRVTGLLAFTAAVRPVDTAARLETALERSRGGVLLVDLRGEAARDLIPDLLKHWPATTVLAFGTPNSEPVQDAEAFGAYAVEDLDAPRQRLQALVARALEFNALQGENETLRKETERIAVLRNNDVARLAEGAPAPLTTRRLPGALRHFDNVEALLSSLAEDIASALRVSRVGIFCRVRGSDAFRLRAGLRCLDDAAETEYAAGDPLVRWLTVRAHMISRSNLEHVKDASMRLLLGQTLDHLGAEVIAPLQARDHLLGWVFIGYRSTGLPFEAAHLENILIIAEHVSTLLENALLYEEVAVQKTLAETLLHSMPTGIVAAGEDGVVRWYNDAAHQILDIAPDKALHQRVEGLGTQIADLVRRALKNDIQEQPQEWTDPRTRRVLTAQARRLLNGKVCLGAVALIHDITAERMLEEKEDQLEQQTFWIELAASMSHEIRNPLVAIKTFAQLLPERYEDDEFRRQFSKIVTDEVDRLGKIIDQINQFAHPRKVDLRPMDIRLSVQKGLDAALHAHTQSGVWVDTAIDDDLPRCSGDEQALADAVSHLITNAMEALAKNENGRILLTARKYEGDGLPGGVAVTVKDNGPGISADIRDKIYSPFCTTKARGMGLGLPIVKRTIEDHNGRLHVDSGPKGTAVTLVLPAVSEPPKTRTKHETHTDRRR